MYVGYLGGAWHVGVPVGIFSSSTLSWDTHSYASVDDAKREAETRLFAEITGFAVTAQ